MSAKVLRMYVWKHCPFCQKASIVAAEHNIKYEEVLVPLDMPDWYKKINPRETVPTLEVDGKPIFESNLVARYLDNLAPAGNSLMGSTDRERYQIEFFMTQVGDLLYACHQLIRDPFNKERRQAVEDNAVYIDRIIQENQTTGPFFLDKFSMADVVILPFLIRFHAVLNYYAGVDIFAKAPLLKRIWAHGKDRPSVKSTTIEMKHYVEHYVSWLPERFPCKGAKGGHVLYISSICPFVDRVRLACAAKDFKPFMVEIDLFNRPEWFNYYNYRETVPVLYTPEGDAVFESQPLVHYVDDIAAGGRRLTPRGDAHKEYAVQLFEDAVGNFVSAYYAQRNGSGSQEEIDELDWAAGELVKLLEEKTFGDGPLFGGSELNAGDIALLPFLVRAKATEGLTNYDLFGKFPRLKAHLDAGLATREAKAVFQPLDLYRKIAEEKMKKQ